MGIKERKEREKEQRKNDIVDAAERTFFSKGLDVATMDDVAVESELSKGTLYLYFKNKDELFWAIHLRGLTILAETMSDVIAKNQDMIGADLVREAGHKYIDYSIKYKNYFDIMMICEGQCEDQDSEMNDIAEACMNKGEEAIGYLIQMISIGIQDGSIDSKYNPVELAVFLWGGLSGMIQLYHTKKLDNIEANHGLPAEDMIRNFIEYNYQNIRKSLCNTSSSFSSSSS